MNSVDLSQDGGLPFVQNSLAFLQNAWQQIFLGLGNALNITGTASDVILLSGCEQSINGGILTTSPGWAVWRKETSPVMPEGEIFYVPSVSLAVQAPPASLYFELTDNPTPPLDPTYMKLTGTVHNVYRTKQIRITYSPSSSNPHILFNSVKFLKDMLRSYSTPIGAITQFAGTVPPVGWELCDGSVRNASANPTYSYLYSIIGQTFGTGQNIGDFRLPDLRDRFVMGVSSSYPIGDTGGFAQLQLQINNLPPHTHSIDEDEHDHTYEVGPVTYVANNSGNGVPVVDSDQNNMYQRNTNKYKHKHGGATGSGLGTSSPINIIPPYIALSYIIRVS